VDEIHEHILYDDHRHISLGSLDGMEDRTVTIGSFSKTQRDRLACRLCPRRLITHRPIRKMHDFLTVAPAPPSVRGITALRCRRCT
jgi:aspartate/methionine/tyrosine aminotransferase